jgi:hypothetical protein
MAVEPNVPDPHPHLNSIQLRLIAEAASGLRGEPVHFVGMPDGTIREVRHGQPGGDAHPGEEAKGVVPPPAEVVVVPAYTENMVPDKPPLTVATIQAMGVAEPIDLLDLPGGLGAADAVFWSESAVEKFLLPYYASVYGNQAARAVADILEAFHGDSGVGGDPRPRSGRLATDELTYAMAHIPKSEYVMLSGANEADGTEPGSDLVVLYKDKQDMPRAERLSDFVRRLRQARQGG